MKGLARDRRKEVIRYLTCSKCGMRGGTLVKVGDGVYEHQDKEKCRILQLRRR